MKLHEIECIIGLISVQKLECTKNVQNNHDVHAKASIYFGIPAVRQLELGDPSQWSLTRLIMQYSDLSLGKV